MRLRIALGVDVNRWQRIRTESFGDGVAFFVGFGLLSGTVERLNQQSTIFGNWLPVSPSMLPGGNC